MASTTKLDAKTLEDLIIHTCMYVYLTKTCEDIFYEAPLLSDYKVGGSPLLCCDHSLAPEVRNTQQPVLFIFGCLFQAILGEIWDTFLSNGAQFHEILLARIFAKDNYLRKSQKS